MPKIALTGGGTLGHITPNIALVPTLKNKNYDIIYIGSKNEKEKGIVLKNNIPFFGIDCDKLRRYIDIKNLMMPINVIKGIKQSIDILKKEKVNIVFSKGGYVALPVVIAASFLKIPVISHEADYTIGLANRISLPFSTKICTNFKETSETLPKSKGIYTGCPIRSELLNGDKNIAKNYFNFKSNKPILLVIGGSLGSVYINNLIRNNLNELLKKFNIIHSCGVNKIDYNYKTQKNAIGYDKIDGYRQIEIIKDMLKDIYAYSDIIISRAGANIIFEILALSKPNLLIPLSKRASRGDQILNANSFKNQSFSVVLTEEEQNQNEKLFLEKLTNLYDNRNFYINSMKHSHLLNSNEKICEIISMYTP